MKVYVLVCFELLMHMLEIHKIQACQYWHRVVGNEDFAR